MRAALLLIAITACSDPPPLTIKYQLKTDGTQVCYANSAIKLPARSCSEVAMPCKSVLDLRIVSPSDNSKQYVKVCQVIPPGRQDLCSIAGIDLPAQTHSLPDDTLEVQVAVYRDDQNLPHDEATGDPICPDDLAFGADGLPSSSSTSPAVGGRAFYHPGDSTTVIDLGCTDLPLIQDPMCSGTNTIEATATVSDFDTDVSVSPSLADNLSVFLGEPELTGSSYSLSPAHLHALTRTVVGPIPGWGGAVAFEPMTSTCLEVLEDVPEATPSLVCRQVTPVLPTIDINGARLSKSHLDRILASLPATQFPPQGLVVGIVLDRLGNPASGIEVTASDASSLIFIDSNGMKYGGFTQDTGIFLSTTAPYGTIFTASATGPTQPTGFGGLVDGKVTVVVLQFNQPIQP